MSGDPVSGPRRGWRETLEPGVYRTHRLACESTRDRKTGRRCGCPLQVKVPGHAPGTTRMVTVTGSITEARAERRRLMAEGRPAVEATDEPTTLDEFTAHYLRSRAPVLSSETIRNRNDDYRLRIAPELGHLGLGEISREIVEAWLGKLIAAASSRRMIVQTVATLRVILGTAVEWGRLTTNPAAKLTLPAPDSHAEQAVERVVGARDLELLFAVAGGARTETMLRAAGEAGLRRGEIAAFAGPMSISRPAGSTSGARSCRSGLARALR